MEVIFVLYSLDYIPLNVGGDGDPGKEVKPETRETVTSSPPIKESRTRKLKTADGTITSTLNVEDSGKTLRRASKKARHRTTHAHVSELVNQEEAVVPVDGASVDVVEADEHPEAAAVPEDACGVGENCDIDTKKGRKKRKCNSAESAA